MNSKTATKLLEQRFEIQKAIRAADEQVAYWTAKKAQSIRDLDRNDAGARLLAWESNRRCKISELLTLGGKAVA